MVETWIEGNRKIKNIEKADASYKAHTLLRQRENTKEAIEKIRNNNESEPPRLEGLLRFLDNNLYKDPKEYTEHDREVLFDTIGKLSEVYGHNSYITVYREWKNQQNLKTIKENL